MSLALRFTSLNVRFEGIPLVIEVKRKPKITFQPWQTPESFIEEVQRIESIVRVIGLTREEI